MNIERKEALWRILVGIISGIILSLWKTLIAVLAIIHWLYVIFAGKRSKSLARFCHIWNDQIYKYCKYMTFATNKRVFPFAELGSPMDKADFIPNPNQEQTKKRKRP